ncbi:hypothetical protein [Paraburkholderia panacisoli]|uniref:hypothetical protein n=1 Tax=Paraburkholderia panacisoli TaxID=2603818 RepID=UPI001FE5ADC2|nr:hypothetical protein [Paraburkholderia panacisoli]
MAKLIHTKIRLQDLKRSLQFYQQAFHFSVAHQLDFPEFTLEADDAMSVFTSVPSEGVSRCLVFAILAELPRRAPSRRRCGLNNPVSEETMSGSPCENSPPPASKFIEEVAQQNRFSTDAVMSMLESVIRGNGSMAQFNHPEFGGSGQWMPGGMTIVPTCSTTI